MSACTVEYHASLKRDERAWLANTVPLVTTGRRDRLDDGEELHEYGHCPRCSSTLLRTLGPSPTGSTTGRLL